MRFLFEWGGVKIGVRKDIYGVCFFLLRFYKSLICFLRTPPPLRQTPRYELVVFPERHMNLQRIAEIEELRE